MQRLRETDHYSSAEDVYGDVMLVWENCRSYNEEGSIIVEDAKYLEKMFRGLWKENGLPGPKRAKERDLNSKLPRFEIFFSLVQSIHIIFMQSTVVEIAESYVD